MSHSSNLAPTKRKNDKAEVLLETVEHRPADYDPDCKCRTCQIVKKLLADCTCEDCRDDVQQLLDKQANRSVEEQMVVQSTENEVTHDDEMIEAKNALQLSPINNDESTSEHISENDHDDRSKSSTPDYAPRFFDDDESESDDSSSDDDNEDKKLDQNCDDDDELTTSIDPDNVLSKQNSSKLQVNEENQEMKQLHLKVTHDDVETLITDSTEPLINNVSSEHNSTNDDDDHSRSSTPDYLPRFFDDESESGDSSSDDNEVDDGDKDDEVSDQDCSYSKRNQRKSIKRSHDAKSSLQSSKHVSTNDLVERFACPSCNQSFKVKKVVYRHYRSVHQPLKPYYCKWHKCAFVTGRRDSLVGHITMKHFNSQKDLEGVKVYIGIRQILTPNNDDPTIEVKSIFERKQDILTACSLCRRIVPNCRLSLHVRSHKTPMFRCTWSDCGFFYSNSDTAKKHVCTDHLKVQFDAANLQHVKQYLVRVCPRTGKQSQTNIVNQIEVPQSMTVGGMTSRIETNLARLNADEDGESSSDDCETGSSRSKTKIKRKG